MNIGSIAIYFNSNEQQSLVALSKKNSLAPFYVKKGCIQQMNFVDLVKYIFNKKYRNTVEKELKSAVSHLVDKANKGFENCHNPNEKWNLVNEVYLKALAKLPEEVFDRKRIAYETIDYLRQRTLGKIEATLFPSDRALINTSFYRTYAEVKVANDLGVTPLKTPSGATGALIMRSWEGKKIGIFKYGKPVRNKMQKLFFRVFPKIKIHLMNPAYKSEVAASLIDRTLKLNIVPPTGMAKLKMKGMGEVWGSLQQFIYIAPDEELKSIAEIAETHEYHLDSKALKKLKGKTLNNLLARPENLSQFQKIVLLDFIMFNLDRHYGNWLVKRKKGQAPFALRLFGIDHGMSLQKFTLLPRFLTQFLWRKLPVSKLKFTQPIKEIIAGIDANQLIKALQEAHLIDTSGPLKNIQADGIRNRVTLLKAMAKEDKTPYYLSRFKTDFRVTRELTAKNLPFC